MPAPKPIFENLEAGANIGDIMEWFDGLDREQVKTVNRRSEITGRNLAKFIGVSITRQVWRSLRFFPTDQRSANPSAS